MPLRITVFCYLLTVLLWLSLISGGSQGKEGSQAHNFISRQKFMTFSQSEIQTPPAKIRFMFQKKKSNPKPQEGQLWSKEALCSRELTGRVDAWKAFSAFRDQVWITCAVHFRVHDSIWKAAVKEIGTRSTKNTMDIKNTKAVVTKKPQSDYYIYCLSHACRLV